MCFNVPSGNSVVPHSKSCLTISIPTTRDSLVYAIPAFALHVLDYACWSSVTQSLLTMTPRVSSKRTHGLRHEAVKRTIALMLARKCTDLPKMALQAAAPMAIVGGRVAYSDGRGQQQRPSILSRFNQKAQNEWLGLWYRSSQRLL